MAADWNDLFVRTDVSETSPMNRRGGLGSPDIIPVGTSPKNPDQYLTEDSYRTYYNLPLQAGDPNYIFVRARNSSPTSPKKGQAFLVMSNPAIVLWPGGDQWTRIKTGKGNYYSQLEPDPVAANGICITKSDPFTFVPNESGHRCLVTWLSTQDHPHPEPPPRIDNVSALAQFLIENPNYAHHNIDIAPNNSGSITQTKPFSSGTLVAQWTFGIQTVNCAGFDVYFSESTPLPDGKYITLSKTTIPEVPPGKPFTATVDNIDVPANWDTTFFYTYDQRGLHPENFSVTFVAFYSVPPGHPLYEFASPYEDFGVPKERIQSDFRGIQVGSIGVMHGTVRS
jgi:hypothetical protein